LKKKREEETHKASKEELQEKSEKGILRREA